MFGYTCLAMELKMHCVCIYPNGYRRVKNTLYVERILGENQRERMDPTQMSLSKNGRIVLEEDSCFCCFVIRPCMKAWFT